MSDREKLSEELLRGWLNMSLTISNERIVTAMTFNESMVCHLLYRQEKEHLPALTATDLCSRLHILKPQMNVILKNLEQENIIVRTRSDEDKRSMQITLTEKGIPLYEQAHQEILRIPEAIMDHLGEEKTRMFASLMTETAMYFHDLVEHGEITSGTRRIIKEKKQ